SDSFIGMADNVEGAANFDGVSCAVQAAAWCKTNHPRACVSIVAMAHWRFRYRHSIANKTASHPALAPIKD
ncbi:hypothetical protein R3X27_19760, partial [Tropicimonas sp. TH_r6]|uniref:hypothetical protein n=1 Tax=Tropicimonas sp. TH_r6 TaxID=3082085 RepID=UPI002952B0F6